MGTAASSARRDTVVPVLHLEVAGSTNDEALQRWRRGETGPLWIVADFQTAGRGRAGRDWQSAAGNLHASLLLPVAARAGDLPQLSLVAGLATRDAIIAAAAGKPPLGLRLKWPNDILIGSDKVGGILVESSTGGAAGTAAVIGVGLNIVAVPTDLERSATSLVAHGLDLDRDGILRRLSAAFIDWVARWDDGRGFAEVRHAWQAAAGAIGEPVTVHVAGVVRAGRYGGLDDDGAMLLIDDTGREFRITHGDVELN